MKTYYPILENVDEAKFSRRVLFEREGGEVCIYSPDRESELANFIDWDFWFLTLMIRITIRVDRGTAVSLEAQSKIYAVRDCRLTAVEAHEILRKWTTEPFVSGLCNLY